MLFDDGKGNSGIEYQFKIIVYIAGCLSKKNVQDYWIYTNRKVDLFDDMIVKFRDEGHYFIYFCQIKYKSQDNYLQIDYRKDKSKKAKGLIDIQEYLKEIHNIMDESKRGEFLKELLKDVPESHIEFWLFSNSSFSERPDFNPLQISIQLDSVNCRLEPHTDNHPIVPVGENGTTYYRFITAGHGQQRPRDLEKFYVFLNQPGNDVVASSIKKLEIDLLTDEPAKEMIKFVTEYLKRATSVTMLRKNIFEAHLLSACLTHFIVEPTEAFVMKPKLAQAWNELVKQFHVTLTSSETKPYLFGCLSQKIRERFGDFDWNKIIRGSYIIPETEGIKEKLKELVQNTEMEHWLGECDSIQNLLKTLWECGYLPLVLNGKFNVSMLNNYKHLGKNFLLLDDKGTSDSDLRVFASAADIHEIELGKNFLKSIDISMQGREPVELSSILNEDIDLMKELKCEQLLYLIREREDLLRSVERSENSKIILENGNYFYIKNVDGGKQVVPIIGKCFQDTENYLKRRLCKPTVKKTIRDSERKVICLLTGDLDSINWTRRNYYNLPDESIDDIVSRVKPQTKLNEAAFIGTKDEHVEGLWSQFSSSEHGLLHIKVERGRMILLKTRNLTNINLYVSYDGPKFNAETFFEETASGITVITGEPGSGKSTLLRSLFNTCDKHSFALFCDLNNYREDLRDDKSDLFKDPINFILRKEKAQLTLSNEQYSNQHLNFLRKFLEKTEELILFLDSFDEVLPQYEEKVLKFIEVLNKSNRRCIIASRLDKAYILGEHFEVTLLKIDILSKRDIDEYLSKELPDSNLDEYPLEFRENPLYLGFLIKLKRGGALPSVINPSSLYNAIIDQSIKHLFQEKIEEPISERNYKSCRKIYLKIYKKLALLEIFDATVTAELNLNYEKLREKCILTNNSKLGLIVQFNEKGPIFLHRTIAEFLLAEWLAENIDEDRGKRMYAILLKDNRRHIRCLLDDILCRNLALHQAIIQKDLPKVKSLCSADDKYLREVDKLNRSALDVAAIYCSDYAMKDLNYLILEEIVQQMISKEINFFEQNSLTNSQWTDYLSREHKYFLQQASRLNLARTAEMYFYCGNKITAGITWGIEKDMLETAMALLRKDISLIDSCLTNFLLKVVPAMRTDLLFELIEFKSSTNPEFDRLWKACRNLLPISEVSGLANLKMKYWGFTAIHIACMSGSADVVRELISLGADVNAVDALGFQPFYYAIDTCSTEILTILAKSFKREVNIPNKWGSPVFPNYLHRCIRKNYVEIAEILLDEGFDKDEKDKRGRTALHIAVKNCREKYTMPIIGETDIPKSNDNDRDINQIKLLLEHKLNVDARDDRGETPLYIAVECERLDVIEMLLRHGANPNIAGDFYDRTPLYTAIRNGNLQAARSLLKYANPNIGGDFYDWDLLYTAIIDRNYEVVTPLLEYANPNIGSDFYGHTPLYIAIRSRNREAVTLLLKYGADVDQADRYGKTALFALFRDDYVDVDSPFYDDIDNSSSIPFILEELVNMGANVNHQDKYGRTALMIAIDENLSEIATMLLENGAEVNLQDKDGYTALHRAVIKRSNSVAEALVKAGANVNHQNNRGRTALMIAINGKLSEIATMLLESGADVNLQDKDGDSALHEAVRSSSLPNNIIAEALVKAGANVNHQNNDGYTALMIAINDFPKIATMLLENGADVNLQNKDGNTALHRAVRMCFFQFYWKHMVKYYKLYGISGFTKNRDAQLRFLSHMEIIVKLLTGDADNRDKIEDAGARMAADLLKVLMDKGANVNAVNERGRTALDVAIKYKTLISHGEEAAELSDGDDIWFGWGN